MEREILQQRASELEALINSTEKHDVFQIRVIADERFDNAIFVMPALEYYDTLWHFDRIEAWAKLNEWCTIFTVTPNGQPCMRLVHTEQS